MQTDDGKSEDTVEHRVQGNIQFRRHGASGMAAGNVPGMLQSKAPYGDSGIFHFSAHPSKLRDDDYISFRKGLSRNRPTLQGCRTPQKQHGQFLNL